MKLKHNFYSKLLSNYKLNLLVISIPIILGMITELFYWPSRNYPFEFDDIPNILKFYKIRSANFTELFFSGPRWISYLLNTILYQFSGFEPNLYRQLNIIFHIISCVFQPPLVIFGHFHHVKWIMNPNDIMTEVI